jgi:hypothetical protein
MASNLPESSAVEPAGPVGQTGVSRRLRAGGTGAISISPVPPAPTAVPPADPLSASCPTVERFALVLPSIDSTSTRGGEGRN